MTGLLLFKKERKKSMYLQIWWYFRRKIATMHSCFTVTIIHNNNHNLCFCSIAVSSFLQRCCTVHIFPLSFILLIWLEFKFENYKKKHKKSRNVHICCMKMCMLSSLILIIILEMRFMRALAKFRKLFFSRSNFY